MKYSVLSASEKYRRIIVNWFLFLVSFLSYSLNAQNFSPANFLNLTVTGVENSSIEWGDFNNDGRLDFIQTGTGQPQTGSTPLFLNLYFQNENGTFDDRSSMLQGFLGVSYGCIALCDFDNDGRLDFFLAGAAGNSTANQYSRLVRQKSDGSGFENKSQLLPGLPSFVRVNADWGDYDNDGLSDLLISGFDGSYKHYVLLYHQKSDGSGFENKSALLENIFNVGWGFIKWADFDRDGKLDLFVSGYDLYKKLARLYRQKGDGSGFEDVSTLVPNIPFLLSGDIAWQDYDNDGLMDFILMGSTTGNVDGQMVRLYHQKSDRSGFEDKTSLIADNQGIFSGKVRWGDFNNDGLPDFLINGFSSYNGQGGIVRLYQQRQNGTGFDNQSATISALIRVSNGANAWGDYNKDGKLDFALAGTSYLNESPYYKPATQVYQNLVMPVNLPPNPPQGFRAALDVANRRATFNWQKSTDDTTPNSALTYSLYIREMGTGKNLTGMLVDSTTGFRRLVKAGEIQDTQYVFNGIEPDKVYRCYVQAVDNSFAGSSVSTLTISTSTPCLETQTIKPGLWTDPQVWSCGQVPDGSQPVIINHVITVPTQKSGKALSITYHNSGRVLLEMDSRLLITK